MGAAPADEADCTDPEDCEEHSEERSAPVLTKASLDAAIDFGQPDFVWARDVGADIQHAIESWPDAKVDEAKCSVRLCRVKFSASSTGQDVGALFDRINAMGSVQGERMIQIDTDSVPAVAVAYFSRGGAVSLSAYLE